MVPEMFESGSVPEQPEAGWYRDPADPRLHRYWTGVEWLAQAVTPPPTAQDAGP